MTARCLLCLLLLAVAAPARAQVAPNAGYATIESANFRVTFQPALEPIARHAAASAERARAALITLVADAPDGVVDIVVTDDVDYTNGFANVFPSNRVTIFARPPVDVVELQYTRDWIELVVTHELAHIYHLDVTGGLGRLVRSIFGRLPAPWPVFPAVATPDWSIEGLATVIESAVTGFGRTRGSYQEMIVRTAILEGGFNDIDILSSTSPVWPGGARVYIYGSLFLDYLERRYGADAIARVVSSISSSTIPPFLWFDRVGSNALGISFRDAYRDWESELRARYGALETELRAQGLTSTIPLTDHGSYAIYPRFSPDGRYIAYTSTDGRTTSRVRVIDAETGREAWSERRNFIWSLAAWADAESLVSADLDFTDPFRIRSDLYRVTRSDDDQLTHAARYEQPDVRGNSIVAVQNDAGTNRLVLLDRDGGLRHALNDYDPQVHWSFPRFAPRGDRIAVARWRSGGRSDLVVMDTLGNVLRELAGGMGVTSSPAWTPDARWILFHSDRTGIPNLFAVDVNDGSRIRQVTNVLTGAFMPDVSPDGRVIAFAAMHRDGFRIERIALDTLSWRIPSADRIALVERDEYEAPGHARARSDSISADVARADTVSGPRGAYRPLRHMRPYFWSPIIEQGAFDDIYFGLWTSGEDLVGRHYWSVSAALDPSNGRTPGTVSYVYRGLPSFGRVHPSISLIGDRFYDLVQPRDSAGAFYVEEREDIARATLSLTHAAWRASSGISLAGELVRRVRYLSDAPPNAVLRDPYDDLHGVRAGAFHASYTQPAFAISRQDGVLLQFNALRRTDRNPQSADIDGRTIIFDGGYSEYVSRNTAYRSLPIRGFARHVLALRAVGIHRSGPGANLVSAGGVSASGFDVPGVGDALGSTSRLLAVRGFSDEARLGNSGWAASLEYRAPLALVSTSLRPLPLFVDRIAAAAFVDAGHAWCDAATAARFVPAACPFTSVSATPLVSAGAEAVVFVSAYRTLLPIRAGAGFPIAGDGARDTRLYFVLGLPF